jgi:hypothetical protein
MVVTSRRRPRSGSKPAQLQGYASNRCAAASGFDQPAVAAPRERRVKEEILRRSNNQSRTKLAEDRRIEPRIRELQEQDILPIDATPHGVRRLAIREPFGKLQDRGARQPATVAIRVVRAGMPTRIEDRCGR